METVGVEALGAAGGACVLATRTSADQRAGLLEEFPQAIVNELGRAVLANPRPETRDPKPETARHVAIVCAGTSDLPVAEEASITLQAMGAPCFRLNDVGVAG